MTAADLPLSVSITAADFIPRDLALHDALFWLTQKTVHLALINSQSSQLSLLRQLSINHFAQLETIASDLDLSHCRSFTAAVSGGRCVAVPAFLTGPDENRQLFSALFGTEEPELRQWRVNGDLALLYSLPPEAVSEIHRCFPSAEVLPPEAGLLSHQGQGSEVHALVQDGWLSMAGYNETGLNFFTSKDAQTQEDVMYCLSNACVQRGLDPHDTSIILSGDIMEENEITGLLRRYFKDVSLYKCPNWLNLPLEMRAGQLHRFSTLLYLPRR